MENRHGPFTDRGSGVLVYKNTKVGLVLTARHVLSDGVGSLAVIFPDGRGYIAKLVGSSRTADLSAWLIRCPQADPVSLALRPLQPGERIEAHGYGQGPYQIRRGTALKYLTPGHLEWSGGSRQGDSGGPVFNADGELCAIVSTTDGSTSQGYTCGQFASRFAGRFPCRPSTPLIARPTPTPTPKPTPTQPQEPRVSYEQLAAALMPMLLDAMAADGRFKGPSGDNGSDGETINQVTGFRVEFLDGLGNATSSHIVGPGGTLQIPPYGLQHIGLDGTIKEEAIAPIGHKIRMRFNVAGSSDARAD